MIVTTYCTAQSLILQLISSDELLVLLWVSVIEVTVGAGGGPINYSEYIKCSMNNQFNKTKVLQTCLYLVMSAQHFPLLLHLHYHHTLL